MNQPDPAQAAEAAQAAALANAAAAAVAAHAAAAAGANLVGHVAVKIGDFWVDDPESWFGQAEASFRRSRVTDSMTKYDHILMKLPSQVVKSIRDLMRTAETAPDPYEQLKARLLKSFAPTKWQAAHAVVHHADLGDRRPSQLMDSMLAAMPDGEQPGILFQYLFLERLPADMQNHLTTLKFESPRAMAEHADILWDSRNSRQSVASVSAVRPVSPARNNNNSRDRDRRRRSPSRNRRQPHPDGLCFFHGRFGDKAHKCEPPCTWAGNAMATGGN